MATVRQIIFDARTISGEMSQTDTSDKETLEIADQALQLMGKLLQGVDPRIGGEIAVKNLSTVAAATVYSTGETLYTAATKTIAVDPGLPELEFNALIKVGGVVVGHAEKVSPTASWNFFGVVVSRTASSLTLDRDIAYGRGNLAVGIDALDFIYISPASTGSPSVSISGLPVNEVVMVTGGLAGNLAPCDVEKFFSVPNNPNFSSSGAFYQSGDSIETATGSNLTNGLGAVFVFYKRKPKTITSMSDVVDLPIKYHALLRDEIAKTLMVRRGKVPPPELQDPLKPLMLQYQVNQKTMEAASQKRNVPNS